MRQRVRRGERLEPPIFGASFQRLRAPRSPPLPRGDRVDERHVLAASAAKRAQEQRRSASGRSRTGWRPTTDLGPRTFTAGARTLASFAKSGCPRPSSISSDRPEEIAVTTSG
jgi:hypothetical protein